ncbi:ROK family protein [Edaphobacter aggregans]|uniref:ROK family protein n=1 Tax=Edaphobacter aggregans TaxID=570835 RepID=UPI001FDFB14B|nr:ROK family protein [Edaphobacter aggregans]
MHILQAKHPPSRRGMLLQMQNVLVIDIGGTHVKVASTEQRVPLKIPSGPTMAAHQMVQQVVLATKGWKYDRISIGYPGPVLHDRPLAEPHNLAAGWIDFDYEKVFAKPIRFINDAAMQALGGYRGGRMLFLGIGTGLGSAMVFEGVVIPLELAHLPYRKNRTYEEYLGKAGLELRGKKRWTKSVLDVIERLKAAMVCEYVLLGGGNAKLMKGLPPHVILGANSNAIDGGIRLWQSPEERKILVAPHKDLPIETTPLRKGHWQNIPSEVKPIH